MPMTIELPDDVLSLLEAEARAEGRTPGELAADRLRQSFATAPRNGNGTMPNGAAKPSYKTFVAPRTGKSMEQVLVEMRLKFNLPDDWPDDDRYRLTAEGKAEMDAEIDAAFREMYPNFDFEAYNAKYPEEARPATNHDAATDGIR